MKIAARGYGERDYKADGKRNNLSLGAYPAVTLAMAREQGRKARELQKQGIDPSIERKRKNCLKPLP